MTTLYRFPLGRPQRASVKEIYDMHEDGASAEDIARAVYSRQRHSGAWDTKKQVLKYLRDPALYDPYIDEIALERALLFEQSVIENLTVFEWSEFCDRLLERQLPMSNRAWREERRAEREAWLLLDEPVREALRRGVEMASRRRRERRGKAA